MTPIQGSLESLLDALPAAVVTDGHGVVVHANAQFAELLGYDQPSPVGVPLQQLIPGCKRSARTREGEPGEWLTLQGIRQDGTPVAVEVSASPLRVGGRSLTVSVVRSKQPKDWARYTLGAIGQRFTSWADDTFFRELVSGIARHLRVPHVLIGELAAGSTRVSTLAVWSGGASANNFEFDLVGSPCAGIMTSSISLRGYGAWRFPDVWEVGGLKLESCLSAPLRDSAGTLVGLLALSDTSPIVLTEDLSELMLMLAGRAERALEQRRQLASLLLTARLLDAAGQAIVALDRRGRVTHWNTAAAMLFGWAAKDAIGKHVLELLPSTPGRNWEEVGQVLLGAKPWSGEFALPHRDGSVVRGYGTLTPLYDDQGDVEGVVAVTTDFAELHAARAELEAEHQLLNSVIESSADSIFAKDRSGRYILANSSMARATGLPLSEILGRRADDLVEVDAAQHIDEVDRAVIETGAVSVGEEWMTLDGRPRLIALTKAPLRDGGGEIRGIVAVARDVTATKEAERALRGSEQMARSIMDSEDRSLAVLRSDGEIVLVNEAWRRFGASNNAAPATIDAVGINYLDVCRRAASDGVTEAAQVLRGLEEVITGQSARFQLEYACHSPTEERWFVVRATPLIADDGHVLISHTDVTEQRRDEEARVGLRAAQQSENFRTDLLRTISHELRTPLTVIRGYLSVLLEYEDRIPPEEVRGMIADANAAAVSLDELIENVMAMSRLEHGMLVLDQHELSLRDVLQDAASSVRHLGVLHSMQVTLPAEPVLVTADPVWIRQALTNLIENARKYAGPASPIEMRAELSQDGLVTVSVCDHGPGVPAEQLAMIFDSFERLDRPDVGRTRGFGLGLAICKGIIEMHGGRIWAAAVEGGGLCVSFTLRRAHPTG
jgi:PAS domain S-box-containing protein